MSDIWPGLGIIDVCTQMSLLETGLCSFPAGHASISYVELTYLALSSGVTWGLFRPTKYPLDVKWTGIFIIGVVGPLILAGWYGWSKVLDNRHDVGDVSLEYGRKCYWINLLPKRGVLEM